MLEHLYCNPATQAYLFSLTGTSATKSKRNGGYGGHTFSLLHIGHRAMMMVVMMVMMMMIGNNH